MARSPDRIRCEATLLRPATPKNAGWSFLVLPAAASAKLPTRGMSSVEGTLAGRPFRATLAPDGQGSHWLRVERALREAAGAEVGDTVALEFGPTATALEPPLPPDLRKALAAAPEAQARWSGLTTVQRRDWIQWLDSAKKAETRARRVASACERLACGQRSICCFDRSGMYGKTAAAPKAAP